MHRVRLGRSREESADSGAVAVEFALILPVLVLLVMGIVNFGWLFGQQLALNQAVRAGARAAVVSGTGEATTMDPAVIGRVRTAAQGTLISDVNNIVFQPGAGALPTCDGRLGEDLQVRVQYPTGALVPMPMPFLTSVTLKAEALFRCEWG